MDQGLLGALLAGLGQGTNTTVNAMTAEKQRRLQEQEVQRRAQQDAVRMNMALSARDLDERQFQYQQKAAAEQLAQALKLHQEDLDWKKQQESQLSSRDKQMAELQANLTKQNEQAQIAAMEKAGAYHTNPDKGQYNKELWTQAVKLAGDRLDVSGPDDDNFKPESDDAYMARVMKFYNQLLSFIEPPSMEKTVNAASAVAGKPIVKPAPKGTVPTKPVVAAPKTKVPTPAEYDAMTPEEQAYWDNK